MVGVCTLYMNPTAILYKGLKLLQILAPGGLGKVGGPWNQSPF